MTFDAARPGTEASAWDEADARGAPAFDLDGVGELVVLAAHPDDETLGAGGLIRRAAELRIPIRVIVVTDGAATGSPGIARTRSVELRSALRLLAPDAVLIQLGFPDGGIRELRDQVGASLRRELARTSPSALVVATWRGDGHRDHRIVGELAAELVPAERLLEYPIWAWHWGDPDDPPWSADRAVSIGIDARAKRHAIRRFASQLHGPEPTLRADVVEHFTREREVFLRSGPPTAALAPRYFERLYDRHDDPWGFTERWYEERKRAATLAALTARRYGRALEIGCSIGVLTEALAARCDDLLAVDVAPRAIEAARERVGDGARFELVDVVDRMPPGPFDLVVVSEVAYYWGDRVDAVLRAARNALAPGGELVACHWRHAVEAYPLRGDEVHERLAALDLTRLVRHEEEDFMLELWSDDPRSVARREALL